MIKESNFDRLNLIIKLSEILLVFKDFSNDRYSKELRTKKLEQLKTAVSSVPVGSPLKKEAFHKFNAAVKKLESNTDANQRSNLKGQATRALNKLIQFA